MDGVQNCKRTEGNFGTIFARYFKTIDPFCVVVVCGCGDGIKLGGIPCSKNNFAQSCVRLLALVICGE